jgi:hypothetical protein
MYIRNWRESEKSYIDHKVDIQFQVAIFCCWRDALRKTKIIEIAKLKQPNTSFHFFNVFLSFAAECVVDNIN